MSTYSYIVAFKETKSRQKTTSDKPQQLIRIYPVECEGALSIMEVGRQREETGASRPPLVHSRGVVDAFANRGGRGEAFATGLTKYFSSLGSNLVLLFCYF